MTSPENFADANVEIELDLDAVERELGPRLEAAVARATRDIERSFVRLESRANQAGKALADGISDGMAQASRSVDRELAGIERKLRTARLTITVDVKVDTAAIERQLAQQNMTSSGAAHGRQYSAGFLGALSTGLGAVTGILGKLFAGGLGGAETRFARIALGTKVAAIAAGQLSTRILAIGGALGGIGAGAVTKLAAGLRIASRFAGQLARDLGRVLALVTVLQAVGRGVGMLANLGKVAAIGTIGFSALLGVATGVSQLLGGPLVSALTAVGAAMGVAAGAAAGILGPALLVAKVGFKGLADGAKAFNEQFKEVDEALSKRIGNMMAPLLTAWHDASGQMKLAFAGALQPAFASMGGLINQFRPQLVGLSTTLGQVGNEVAKSLAGPAARQGFADMLAASNDFFSAFKGESGLGGLASGLVSFAGTAAKTFSGVGVGINDALLSAGEWLRNISPEQMRSAFDQVRQVFDNIAAVVGPVLSGLRQLGGISAPALAPGFKSIGDAIVQATPGIMQMARELMPALGQAMTNIAPLLPGIVDAFTPWASVVAVLAPHIATLVSHLGPLAPVILGIAVAAKTITSAMVAYNAIMAIASVGQGVFAAATGAGTASLAGNTIALAAHRVATVAGTIATKAAAIAMRAFGVALRFATGPIGLIITAVALVGTAIWAFFTKTETGRQLWATIWNGIKAAVSAVVEWFTGTAVPWLKSAWDNIATGLTWLWENVFKPIWDGIKFAVGLAVEFIRAEIEGFKAIWAAIEPVLLWLWHNVIEPVWDGISSAIRTVVDWIRDTAVPWVQQAWKDFTTGLDYIVRVAKEVWEQVKEKFTNMVDFVTSLPEKIRSAASGMWDGIKDAFKSAINFIIDAWNSLEFKIPGFKVGPVGYDGFTLGVPDIPRLRDGGIIRGPGTGTSDSILGVDRATGVATAAVSNGESVNTEKATRANWWLYERLNAGMPLAKALGLAGLAGLAGGGRVAYGLDPSTSISQGSKGFPDWVYAVAGQFNLKASTYAGHQVKDGQNKGIDWWGSVADMQRFAEYLKTVPGMKQVIWSNPETGEKIGVADGQPVGPGTSQPGYYRADWKDHTNHVHTSQDYSFGGGADAGSGAGLAGVAGVGDVGAAGTGTGAAATSAFSSAAAAAKGGVTPVWVENWPSGGSGSGSGSGSGGSRHSSVTGSSSAPAVAQPSTRKATDAELAKAKTDTAKAYADYQAAVKKYDDAKAQAGGDDSKLTAEKKAVTDAYGALNRANESYKTLSEKGVTVPAAVSTGNGPATVPLTQNADGTWTSSDPEWAKLIKRESGGKPKITQGVQDANSASGDLATGLFQITGGTWRANGGGEFAASAKDATPEQQAIVAARIFKKSGGAPWGSGAGQSGRENEALLRAGLTTGGSTPVPSIQPTMKPLNTTVTPSIATPASTVKPTDTTTPTVTTQTGTAEQTNPLMQAAGFGQPTNKTWFEAVGSDLPSQVLGWGGDALKEVGGEFFDLVGLGGLFGKGVDFGVNAGKAGIESGKKAASAAISAGSAAGAGAVPGPGGAVAAAAGQAAAAPIIGTAIFNNQDQRGLSAAINRGVNAGSAPIREGYRS